MKYIISILFSVILIFGSCTKDFEEMNKSPNNPVDVPAINIFTHVIQESVGRQLGGWMQHTYVGCWSQQWTKVQYVDEDKYMPRDLSGEMNGPYTGELADLKIIMDKATEDGDDALLGAALVMKSWVFMYLTDMLGDIVYSEALQGFEADGDITPAYDAQQDVYTGILADLAQANTLLGSTTVNFGSGDIMYGGDPVQWQKFCNSLRLRALNRIAGTPWSFTYDMVDPQSDVSTTAGAAPYANADADIASILSQPMFGSNADNAKIVYPGLPYRNPIFNTLYTRTDQGIAETIVEWLKARNDPRVHVYAQPVPNSYPPVNSTYDSLTYVGFQNGSDEAGAPFPQVSLLGTKIAYTETSPLYVMTYDEVEFIKAEYYMRTGDATSAQTHYENGIKASMARWGCADGGTVAASMHTSGGNVDLPVTQDVDYAAYLAQPLVDFGAAANDGERYQRICEQKWAAIFGEGIEAWTEVRRTGFPARVFEYELDGAFYPNLGMPVRLTYPTTEEVYNSANLADAKSRQHIEMSNEGIFSTSGTTSQLWWNTRKNPIPTETDYPAVYYPR